MADFHALRHTFVSNLANSKMAQPLARHSTITLTMDRYTHSLEIGQLAGKKWRKCMGIEPTESRVDRPSSGFEDRGHHQVYRHFRV